MAGADVSVNILAEFTGAKAFKKADNATDKLIKNVKTLAKTFGVAFGTAQVIAYGKASIKAAAEDQKAQKQLALALKNVGLGRDTAVTESYIAKLESEFGVVDDKLRPAYQTLAVATRDTAESQKLLQLSLDISAATGKDLGAVTSALSRAYLGNNTALGKLGVGISKADLKAGKFNDIVDQLSVTFKDAAKTSASTFQGSMDKLAVATQNVSETIGTGLIDALKGLGDQDSVDNLAQSMQDAAVYTADVIRGIGKLIEKLKGLPGVGNFNIGMIPIVGAYLEILRKQGEITAVQSAADNQHLKDLQASFKIIEKTVNNSKKLTAEQLKQLAAAKLKAAIDKANAALGKADDVFNMDKIQVAAALASEAEQLGKATSSAQLLQIANDTARLRVKQDIFNLEDAIASKDEKAITAATAKLNEDLKILGALTGQSVKLADIKSILDSLKPAELISQTNLDAALAKIKEMIDLLNKAQTQSKATVPNSATLGSGIPVGDYVAPVAMKDALAASTDALIEYANAAAARANAFADLLDMQNQADLAALQTSSLYNNSGALQSFRTAESATVNIYANTIANPDELTNLVQDAIIKINRQGSSLTQAGAL